MLYIPYNSNTSNQEFKDIEKDYDLEEPELENIIIIRKLKIT